MSRENPQRDVLFDLITFILVIASVVVVGASLLIAANPEVPFNPFPPPTVPALLELSTFTPSPTFTPSITPTLTPSQTLTPSITPTFTPSMTPSITPTYTPSLTPPPTDTHTPTYTPVLPGLPTNTPDAATPVTGAGIPAQPGIVIPTATDPNAPGAAFPFTADEPVFQRNTNDRDCDWLSIAGSVTGLQGEPLLNLPIEVAGEGFLEVQFSGTRPEFGASGFEVNLGDRPQRERYSIRLLGATGEAISDYIFVTTGDTCDRNVAVVEFVQVR